MEDKRENKMDLNQATGLITEVLTKLGYNTPQLVNLLLGTMAQESQMGKYQTQFGGGPGRGIFQCENATFQDVLTNFLSYHKSLESLVESYAITLPFVSADDLLDNPKLAVAFAACSYIRHSVPHVNDNAADPGTAYHYYKTYYNGPGAATYLEFLKNWTAFGIGQGPVATPSLLQLALTSPLNTPSPLDQQMIYQSGLSTPDYNFALSSVQDSSLPLSAQELAKYGLLEPSQHILQSAQWLTPLLKSDI